MNEQITPEIIYNRVINNSINKSDATQLLISLTERGKNDKIRVNSIKMLSYISPKNIKVKEILENTLISDEKPVVRAEAAKFLIQNHLDTSITPLRWAIQHDASNLVLKNFIKQLRSNKSENIEYLREILANRIKDAAILYEIIPEEVKVLLELGYDIIIHDEHHSSSHFNNQGGYVVSIVRNRHVTGLSFYCWELYEIPASIKLLSKLTYLNLSCTKLKKIPNELSKILKYDFEIAMTELTADLRKETVEAVRAISASGVEVLPIPPPSDLEKFYDVHDRVAQRLVGRIYPQELLNQVYAILEQARTPWSSRSSETMNP